MTEPNLDRTVEVESKGEEKNEQKVDQNENKGHKNGKKNRVKRGKFRRFAPHVLAWVTAVGTLRVVFNNVEESLTPMQLHVILGVIGYQVLMGHGTLLVSTMAHKDAFFFPNTNKKTIHWVTQAAGAACALAGAAVIYRSRETHFNSIHSLLGLASLILTLISSLNGVVFYYWQELGITKGNIKFLHTLTGALTFVLSTASLCYGYNKKTFYRWTSAPMAYFLMSVAIASIIFFSLSPGRIILNWFRPRDRDAAEDGKEMNGKLKDGDSKEQKEKQIKSD